VVISFLGRAGGKEKIFLQDRSKGFLAVQRLLTRTTITGKKGSNEVPQTNILPKLM